MCDIKEFVDYAFQNNKFQLLFSFFIKLILNQVSLKWCYRATTISFFNVCSQVVSERY